MAGRWDVQVSHKLLQPRSFRALRPSVLGDGLPERLRSTLVALLGITAAAGLGVVALALQQSFPLVGSGPVPDPPPQREALKDRVVAKQKPVAPRRDTTRGRVAEDGPSPSSDDPGVVAPTGTTPPEGSAVLVTGSAPAGDDGADRKPPPAKAPPSPRPSVQAPPAAPAPAPEPIGTPLSETSEPAPEPTPEPAPEPVASSHPGNGHAYGKGNGNGLGNSGSPPGQASGKAHGHTED